MSRHEHRILRGSEAAGSQEIIVESRDGAGSPPQVVAGATASYLLTPCALQGLQPVCHDVQTRLKISSAAQYP